MVDQLRCALKAKNLIIEQLEEEKKDAESDAEMKISELTDKLRLLETAAAAANVGIMMCLFCPINSLIFLKHCTIQSLIFLVVAVF